VFLARTGEWLARFALSDAIRPDAARLVAELKRAGKRVHLLSGDTPSAVQAVALALEIDRWTAAASPEEKQAYVRTLQGEGRVVVMVGDGVNDAPVIAQADVSVAMGTGAELAQLRADAVLLSSSPAALADALGLAARSLAVIRQNLLWATVYNVVAIPAAALGFVTPWLAGVGMSGSSLAVVLNALRLRSGAGSRGRG
jgi:Cu2+-exporting ATPase